MPSTMGTYRVVTINDLRVIRNVGGVATPSDISFANSVSFNTDIETITYEGDGQRARKYIQTAFDLEIAADDWPALALGTIFGKTTVTTGLPVGRAKREYWGTTSDQAGAIVGIEAQMTVEDLVTATNKEIVVGAPLGTLSPPTPPDAKNIAKAGLVAKFSARKTSIDVGAVALPGVPSGGAFWYMDELT